MRKAYSQSKIAVAYTQIVTIATRELDARSKAAGWGITSNLSHPGVSPTNLLSAQPGMGRQKDTFEVRAIRAFSRMGMLVGTVGTAALPALLAATGTDAQGGQFYGPKGRGNLRGAPAQQELWAPLRSMDDARRLWEVSERLVGVRFSA